MSSLQRHKERSYSAILGTLVALVLLVVVAVIQPVSITSAVRGMGLPFLRMRAAADDATSIFGDAWASKETLARENRELKEKNQALALKAAMYDELKAQYDDLAGLETDEVRVARVLSTPRTAGYDVLILDIGTVDGVEREAFVLGYDMSVLGRLDSVGARSSRAVLFSSPESKVPALLPKIGLDVVALGQGGGAFILEVPQETEIAVGDAITLRALPSKALAFVTEVSVDPTDAFKTVYASVPINIFDVRHVGVRR